MYAANTFQYHPPCNITPSLELNQPTTDSHNQKHLPLKLCPERVVRLKSTARSVSIPSDIFIAASGSPFQVQSHPSFHSRIYQIEGRREGPTIISSQSGKDSIRQSVPPPPMMNWTDWTDCWERKHTHTAAGYGIFARQDIHRGQPIFRVCPGLEVDLYPIRVVNHSCIPNMFALEGWDPRTGLQEIRFYAIREIEMGEELTRCYDDIGILREDNVGIRRAWMRTLWEFECLCPRCVGEWPGVEWKCPEHWVVDYNIPDHELTKYLNGLVHMWKDEDECLKLQTRDKARILAQRTVFSLRNFRDDVKSAAEKVKRSTSDSRHRLKLESKILHTYIRRRRVLEDRIG